jgi:hypothetical protein
MCLGLGTGEEEDKVFIPGGGISRLVIYTSFMDHSFGVLLLVFF